MSTLSTKRLKRKEEAGESSVKNERGYFVKLIGNSSLLCVCVCCESGCYETALLLKWGDERFS